MRLGAPPSSRALPRAGSRVLQPIAAQSPQPVSSSGHVPHANRGVRNVLLSTVRNVNDFDVSSRGARRRLRRVPASGVLRVRVAGNSRISSLELEDRGEEIALRALRDDLAVRLGVNASALSLMRGRRAIDLDGGLPARDIAAWVVCHVGASVPPRPVVSLKKLAEQNEIRNKVPGPRPRERGLASPEVEPTDEAEARYDEHVARIGENALRTTDVFRDHVEEARPEALCDSFEWLGKSRSILDKDIARDNVVTSLALFDQEAEAIQRMRDEIDGVVRGATWWGSVVKNISRRATALDDCRILLRTYELNDDDPWLFFITGDSIDSPKRIYGKQSFHLTGHSSAGAQGINEWHGDCGPDGVLERAAEKFGKLQTEAAKQFAYRAIAAALHDKWREARWIGGTVKDARRASLESHERVIQRRRSEAKLGSLKKSANQVKNAISALNAFSGSKPQAKTPRSRGSSMTSRSPSARRRRSSLKPVSVGIGGIAIASPMSSPARASAEGTDVLGLDKIEAEAAGGHVGGEAEFKLAMQNWRTRRTSISRIQRQADVLYEPRLKVVEGTVYDIANLPFDDLPVMYQSANIIAAKVASMFIEANVAKGVDLDSVDFEERAAANQHVSWMNENPWCSNPLQMCPYAELSEEEKEKDRAVIRLARKQCQSCVARPQSSVRCALLHPAHALSRCTLPRSYTMRFYHAAVTKEAAASLSYEEFALDLACAAQAMRQEFLLDADADILEADPAQLHQRMRNASHAIVPTAVQLAKLAAEEDGGEDEEHYTPLEIATAQKMVELKRGATAEQIEFRADVAFDAFTNREHRLIGLCALPLVCQVDAMVHDVKSVPRGELTFGPKVHADDHGHSWTQEILGVDRITKMKIFKAMQLLDTRAQPVVFSAHSAAAAVPGAKA